MSVVSADSTVYFNTSKPPTSASVLSASGAKITDGNGNTVSGTLAATVPRGCGAAAGTCTSTITGIDTYGFDTAPVTVELKISAAAVSVAHVTATFTAAGSSPSQVSLVSALGATVRHSTTGGTPVVDTSKVEWSVPGTYAVTVGDREEHDAAGTVSARIRVVPVPFVTLPASTVYLPLSAADPLPAASLLADVGATLTDVYGNAIGGMLSADTSAVNGSVAGTYKATITGTDDYGFASSAVTVTVVIYLSAQRPGTVSITGALAVGATLTATPAGWSGLSDPEYQWLRSGVEIRGATGPTYTVTAADAGHTLSVRMTVGPEWYSTASAVSAAVTVPKRPPRARTALKVSSASYRSGSVRLKLKVTGKGRLTVKVTTKSGKKTITLGARKVLVKKTGTVSTSVKLSGSAKSLIKRRSVKTTVTITFRPSVKGAKKVSLHRTLIIKKRGMRA